MKSTKNVLMTGVALAIALFSSIQTFSMERIDMDLTSLTTRIEQLETKLNFALNSIARLDDPDRGNNFVQRTEFLATIRSIVEQINHAGKILDVLGNLFVQTGMLTMQELQQRIHNTQNKSVGLQMNL